MRFGATCANRAADFQLCFAAARKPDSVRGHQPRQGGGTAVPAAAHTLKQETANDLRN